MKSGNNHVTIKVSADLDHDLKGVEGAIEKLILKHIGKSFHASVIVDSPHARFIEFGTTGSKAKPRGGKRVSSVPKEPTEFHKRIVEWANSPKMKGKNLDPDAVYYKILNEGIPPQPFFRPAILEVQEELNNGGPLAEEIIKWEGEGSNPAMMVAEEMKKRMKDILKRNNTNYKNGISDSIRVEVTIQPDSEGTNIDTELMNNPDIGIYGTRAADYGDSQ